MIPLLPLPHHVPPVPGLSSYNRPPRRTPWYDVVANWIGPENILAMDSVLGHHRTGWFAQVSNGFAGFSDAATGGMAGYLRRGLGYDDVIDRSSRAYQERIFRGAIVSIATSPGLGSGLNGVPIVAAVTPLLAQAGLPPPSGPAPGPPRGNRIPIIASVAPLLPLLAQAQLPPGPGPVPGPPPPALPWGIPGYIDINVGFIIGGGAQIGAGPPGPFGFAPSVHLYFGLQDPGVSVNWAPTGTICPGINVGTSAYLPIKLPLGFQIGVCGAGPFWEVGVGSPGVSVGGWWVW